jgi:hypothetical protein
VPRHLPTYEEPTEFTTSSGVTWRRIGSCNGCGGCCKSGNPLPDLTPTVEGACALYREDVGCSDKTHPYYANGCAHWPARPEHIVNYPDCSYRFERVG